MSMEFNFLNFTGALIVVLMLVPNILYARKAGPAENKVKNRAVTVLEKEGRSGSMAFMVLPLFAKDFEFGFGSAEAMAIWVVLCSILLSAYFVFWVFYSKKPGLNSALALAIIPSAIFILRGFFLYHPPLIVCGVIFALSHTYITYKNHK